jgi:hypothetical protein
MVIKRGSAQSHVGLVHDYESQTLRKVFCNVKDHWANHFASLILIFSSLQWNS